MQLLSVGTAALPRFSFFGNRREGFPHVRIEPGHLIIIERLHAVSLRPHFSADLRAVDSFVTADVAARAERIRVRDRNQRGRPPEEFEKWFHLIRLAEERWILAQQFDADWVVDTTMGSIADSIKITQRNRSYVGSSPRRSG